MKCVRLLALLCVLPLASLAADRQLKADLARSYVDVDVKVTVGSFTAHLDKYELRGVIDDKNRIKPGATLTFKFVDLKTGNPERDQAMLEWLGGADAAGKFEAGILAITPDGQGQVTGNLTFHGTSSLVEFPVNVSQAAGVYTITGEATVDTRQFKLKVLRRAKLVKVDPYVKVRFKFTGVPGDVIPPPAPAK